MAFRENRLSLRGNKFKAVTLAMGVAVVVLSCLGGLELHTAVTLLGIGMACAGAAMLAKQ